MPRSRRVNWLRSCMASYGGSGCARTAELVPQSVSKPPGSTIVTRMPNSATSAASASLKPSSPHLEAW